MDPNLFLDKENYDKTVRNVTIQAMENMEVLTLNSEWQKLPVPQYSVAKIQNISYGEGKNAKIYISSVPPLLETDGFYLEPDNYTDFQTGDKSIYVRSDEGATIAWIYQTVNVGGIDYKKDIEMFVETINGEKDIPCTEGLYFVVQNLEPIDTDKTLTFSIRTENTMSEGFEAKPGKFIGIPVMVDATIRLKAERVKIAYALMPPASTNLGISKDLEEKLNYYFALIDIINHTYVNKETFKGYLDQFWKEMQEYMEFNLADKVNKLEYYRFVQDAIIAFEALDGSIQDLDAKVERYYEELCIEDHRLDTVKFERKTPLHLWAGLKGSTDFMDDRIDIRIDTDDECILLEQLDEALPDGETEKEDGKVRLWKSIDKRDPETGKLVTQVIAIELDADIQTRIKRDGDYFTDIQGNLKEVVHFDETKKYIEVFNSQNKPTFDLITNGLIEFTNFDTVKGDSFIGNLNLNINLSSDELEVKLLLITNPVNKTIEKVIVLKVDSNISSYVDNKKFILFFNNDKTNIGFKSFNLTNPKVVLDSLSYSNLDENTYNLIQNKPDSWILETSKHKFSLMKREFLNPINFTTTDTKGEEKVEFGTSSNYYYNDDNSVNLSDIKTNKIISYDSERLLGEDAQLYFNMNKHYYTKTIEDLKVDDVEIYYTRPGSEDRVLKVNKSVTALFIKDILNRIIDNDGHRHTNVDYKHDGFMSKEDKTYIDIMKAMISKENYLVYDIKDKIEDIHSITNIFKLVSDNTNKLLFGIDNDGMKLLKEENKGLFFNENNLSFISEENNQVRSFMCRLSELVGFGYGTNVVKFEGTKPFKLRINNSITDDDIDTNGGKFFYETLENDKFITKEITIDKVTRIVTVNDSLLIAPRIYDTTISPLMVSSPIFNNTTKNSLTINLNGNITDNTFLVIINNNYALFGKHIKTDFNNLVGFNLTKNEDNIVIEINDTIKYLKVYKLPLNDFIDTDLTEYDNVIFMNVIKEFMSNLSNGKNMFNTIRSIDKYDRGYNYKYIPNDILYNSQDSKEYPIIDNGNILSYTKIDKTNILGSVIDGNKVINYNQFISNSKFDTKTINNYELSVIKKRYPNAYINIIDGGVK